MAAFYHASVRDFLGASESELTGLLSVQYALEGFQHQQTDQTMAWLLDVKRLQSCLQDLLAVNKGAATWTVLLEFNIPRKMKRIDVVLLAGDLIVLLELKTHVATSADCLQVEEYALLLHYFHEPSHGRKIIPAVVSKVGTPHAAADQHELPFRETPAFWIAPVARVGWSKLARFLQRLEVTAADAIDAKAWDVGAYRPVPTIIEAALMLQSGLAVREIAHAGAARHDVDELTGFIHARIEEAKRDGKHLICFVTGVPGSGKTLVGLNLAFSRQLSGEAIHFMSGNGPLVKVLQTVLGRHRMAQGVRALDARIHAKTLIENVHVFARTYTDDDASRAPSNRVVIFDEAQRAWNKEQNKAKFKRDYSEPEMLLKIMERHPDWSVVIALVGGGQEINSGEAGLGEWGKTIAERGSRWRVYASPEALQGGAAVAGTKLGLHEEHSGGLVLEPALHLAVSIRSLKAASYAAWVNAVVDGDAEEAAAIKRELGFPILLSRDLAETRKVLRRNTLGHSRCGLVGSAQAARLRAEGLEPDSAFHGGYPWEHWYLAPREDTRSSFQLEVFATEFEIQGLELDWIGLCWGGDFVWSKSKQMWQLRKFRAANSKWSEIKSESTRLFRRNAYRVLLTRARQGIVLYVPDGDDEDPSRLSREFQETASFLLRCGAVACSTIEASTEGDEQIGRRLF